MNLSSVLNELMPYLIPVLCALVPMVGVFLMHDKGSVVVTAKVQLANKGAGLGLSYNWNPGNKCIVIGFAHVAVTIGFKFGDYLIIPMKQVQAAPAPVVDAAAPPVVQVAPVGTVTAEPAVSPSVAPTV